MDPDRPVMPIRVFCFACGARAFVSGCRILRGYPTTAPGYLAWLSDSLWLSDNCTRRLALVVGCFAVIRQLRQEACPGCRILRGYPTTSPGYLAWLSDSAWLSDNCARILGLVVGFCAVIRQLRQEAWPGCRILRGYPTTAPGGLAWLSDSLRLSGNCARRLGLVVGFCVVIRQLRQEAWPGCRILRGYPTTALEGLDWLSDSAWLSDNPKYFFGFQ